MNSPGSVPIPFTNSSLQSSRLYCRRVTRFANSSFPLAFRLLPEAKRRAMEALYAFLRVSDDLADEPGEAVAKRERLRSWRAGLIAAFGGRFSHPVHPALASVVRRYAIPPSLLVEAVNGVESDLELRRFTAFAELYPYCYRVASAVGLACVRIWGLRAGISPREVQAAETAAEAAGIAFQLTNILRDLREDFLHGRIYLPEDELKRFGVAPDKWDTVPTGNEFRELMRFQVARADDYYRRAEPLERLLSRDGRAIFRVMSGVYRRLLREIADDPAAVFSRRIRVSPWRKCLILVNGWAMKRNWA